MFLFYTEYCHFDPDDGLLAIIQGSKQVRLFAAGDLESLYPNDLGTKGRTVQAQVNCDDPDISRHPLFAKTRCHYGMLRPGQL